MSTVEMLSEYRVMFLAAGLCVIFIILIILIAQIVSEVKRIIEENKKDISKEEIQMMDYNTLKEKERIAVIRKIAAPDAVDPSPDDHMIIYDSTKKCYVRTLTISRMAKVIHFANTLVPLFEFPDSEHTVYIEPINEINSSAKLDHHLVILESEWIAASGNSNRRRKLQTQYAESNKWARQIETGKNKFFRVGFVFSLYAESLEDLNKRSDAFRNYARGKGLEVSACVAVQSEAYCANAPFNFISNGTSKICQSNGIFYHTMDQKSVSALFNYTSCSFSHRDGVPLGHERHTNKPFIYNPYHSSFNGFTFCVTGMTGTGKSAMMKMLAYRTALLKYRFASLDVQAREGTNDGEYAGICALMGGINFELKSDTDNCLNIFEVMESKKYIKTGIGKGYEKRTLDLNSAISQSANLIKIMILENGESVDLHQNVLMNSIIKNAIKKAFAYCGIIHGDPDSLYTIGTVVRDGELKQDKIEKDLPTISDFYRILLKEQKSEKNEDTRKMRNTVLLAMEDYVRDLYYTEKSLQFFSEKEYLQLPIKEGTGVRLYKHPEEGYSEEVRHIHGTRGYFDGQSTLRYSKDIPWVNVDCSQLDEDSRKVAMSVGQNYINERIIKGNSENRRGSSKILVYFDEAHMLFKLPPARELLAEIVRTARKRNAALGICTQTLREFDAYEDTYAIRANAAALFIFKQAYSDREYLMKTLGITATEVDEILAQGGDINQANSSDKDKELEKEQAQHRGEVTIIINNTAIPIKVDYCKATEKHAVETAASEIIEQLGKEVS